MKKLVRSILSGVLAVSILGSSMTAWAAPGDGASLSEEMSIRKFAEDIKNIYISQYPEQADMINEMVDTISVTEEFIYIFEQDADSAFRAMEYSLNRALIPSSSPLAWRDEIYYNDNFVQQIQQSENNYCGIASIMMALIGCGKMDPYDMKFENGKFVPTDDAWAEIVKEQEKIATEIRIKYSQPCLVPGGEGVVVGNMTAYLNYKCGFNSSKFKYEYRHYTYSKEECLAALNDVIDCLIRDTVPIIQVKDTSVLWYYNNNKFPHYIVVESVDLQAESMNIIDPHYDNQYYGLHTISFDEFYQIANNSLGVYLAVYTDKGSKVW